MIREPAFRHDRVREKKLTMAHRESGTRNQLTPCGIGIRCPNHWPSGTPWCRRSAELDQVPVESAHQAGEAGSNPIADRTELVETGPGGSGDGQRFAPGISGLLAECVEERTHRLAIDLYVELEPPGAFAHSERLIWILLARSQLGDTLGQVKGVVVPVEDGESTGKSFEQRIGGRCRRQIDRAPADLRTGCPGEHRATRRLGEKLCTEADAQGQDPSVK